MDITIILYIIGGLLLLILIVFAIRATKKDESWKSDVKLKLPKLDKDMNSNNFTLMKSALIELDKLFSYSLKMSGFKGNTMGERLKSAKNYFSRDTYNLIWQAHKVRNSLVHDVNYNVNQSEVKKNYKNMRSALMKLL